MSPSSPVRDMKSDELRREMQAARRAVVRVMRSLDALGYGKGEAIGLADEARELLVQVEEVHFKSSAARVTGAVERAVELARQARAEREGGGAGG